MHSNILMLNIFEPVVYEQTGSVMTHRGFERWVPTLTRWLLAEVWPGVAVLWLPESLCRGLAWQNVSCVLSVPPHGLWSQCQLSLCVSVCSVRADREHEAAVHLLQVQSQGHRNELWSLRSVSVHVLFCMETQRALIYHQREHVHVTKRWSKPQSPKRRGGRVEWWPWFSPRDLLLNLIPRYILCVALTKVDLVRRDEAQGARAFL